MTGAFVILIAMVIIGVILYVTDIIFYRHGKNVNAQSIEDKKKDDVAIPLENHSTGDDSACCGLHLMCEKTGLSPILDEIVYYDDEELDRFKGKSPNDYSFDEIEEFRDILMTLLPQDVAGWARSIQLREIELPNEIRDELLLIVGDLRNQQ